MGSGLSGFVRYVLNNLLQNQSTDCDQSCLAHQNTYELFGMGEELEKKLGGSFLDESFSMCEDLGKKLRGGSFLLLGNGNDPAF